MPEFFPYSAGAHRHQTEIALSILVVCSKLLTVNQLFKEWVTPVQEPRNA
jgi:hypothetical protein